MSLNIHSVLKSLYPYEYVIDSNKEIVSVYDLYCEVKKDIQSKTYPSYFYMKYWFLELETGKEYDFVNRKYFNLPTNRGTMTLHEIDTFPIISEGRFDTSKIVYVSSRYPSITVTKYRDNNFESILAFFKMILNNTE